MIEQTLSSSPATDSIVIRPETRSGDNRAASRVAQERITAALRTYPEGLVAITTGSQAGLVLADLVWSVAPTIEVALLDTGLSDPERLRAVQQLAQRSGGHLTWLRPELSVGEQEAIYGPDLWASRPALCCLLRQESVIRRALAGRPAWLSAYRRSPRGESSSNGTGREADHGRPRIDPIGDWSDEQIHAYLVERGLPGADRPLGAARGAACSPCTRLQRQPTGHWQAWAEPDRLLFP